MKKKIKYFLLVLILLFVSCGQKATTYEAKEALSKHLVERYGEEFEIGYIGRRSDGDDDIWYQAEIYPSKYVGTPKERDKYYRRSGTVNIEKGILGEKLGKAGDTYGIVKVNESAEEFYGKKLKELFGDNVLQVYDIWFNRILEDYSFENIVKVSDEERTALIIKGGIYIFGRVENDEDREWYRKQIYEFIQFMKETETFEYVSLGIIIVDDRVLTKQFENNNKLKQELSMNRELLSDIDFRKKKKELMNQITEKLSSEKIKIKLEGINRTIAFNSDGGVYSWSFYNSLLYSHIYSEKYIESQKLDHREKLKYNKIEDVKFRTENY
ncbi:hypothetical protein [uncultured Fusobacterium sp.]|uniref:hypothetical protein n=1 Tax=uncultured Fusobacterium sp. TaxID=159267 RepID=UPI0027DB1A32|nr:hypothetical protein [uncultured Fusobacterium sp.]